MFGVLLVSFLFVLPFQFSYANKYEFANFNTHSGTCFGLTFSDPVFEKDMYILKGKYRTGLIDMFVYPEGREPRIVFKSPQRLIRTDIKYYPKEGHIGVFAKLDYGQGWCKVSFDLMTVNLSEDFQTASSGNSSLMTLSDKKLCMYATSLNPDYLEEAERRGLSCVSGDKPTNETALASNSSSGPNNPRNGDSAYRCKPADLHCNLDNGSNTQIGSTIIAQSSAPTSSELTAAKKEAERLRKELAALKAQQEQQQIISSKKQKPVINIAGIVMNGPQGTIKGYVHDNTGIAEVRVDGKLVEVDGDGNFMANTYVPQSGINVSVQAVDLEGLTSSMSVRLDRLASSASTTITFDRLNPLGRNVANNKDALALIIGVNEYAKTPAKAHYADSDAQVFSDYAIQKLGIPANRVKTLVNNNADESGMLLATKRWLARAAKQGKTDVYIFFAGHGLASDDGSKMYLLPYDGAPELLDKTAILRDELFADISAANPRSVTVFLDTCYSGTTRGTDMLIASRPIAIRALEQSIPDNFTVMTAAAGDQTAKPLEEAKHGMFSYFLMKGMEGEADADKNNEITAGELHSYVQTNVIQQSSGSQTPELQGDADRVLVKFQ